MGSFAERQLNQRGWKKGEGLGKNKSGISTAIKVAKKNDTRGVGTKGENFEFAWWDHVYNKVSSSVQVENVDGDVKVKVDNEDLLSRNQMGIISTELVITHKGAEAVESEIQGRELNTEQLNAKRALYGYFVKSFAGSMNVEKSFATKISDKDLFEACGRLTARKGARAEQKGKLERTEHELSMASIASQKDTKPQKSDDSDSTKTVNKKGKKKDKREKEEKTDSKKKSKSKKSIKEKLEKKKEKKEKKDKKEKSKKQK
ncbi:hypothetical protein DSO57_1035983 [Entomophthora muscae]|uniref:Uncharacterized protein n=1 Tax=Entomophthora muscae TaxID=34485 RepID=A0ACC2TLM7_9FUNG|nr:hypothetical protein DSO57_1035983 [Entomophthora muscae]